MGQLCNYKQHVQAQNENFKSYRRFGFLCSQRSYRKYQHRHEKQKCIIQLRLRRKGSQSMIKTQNKQQIINQKQPNKRSIIVRMNQQGINMINHGIFENQIKNIFLQQEKKGCKIIIVEEPQCSNTVNIKDIYIVVVKGFMDAEALGNTITPNSDGHQQILTKIDIKQTKKVMVIVYWPRINAEEIEHLLIEAIHN